jgi:DNA-binding transcriptional LysR family regulator
MDLRHLRYFIAVAEELHFTRAAERLGIKQPPLSMQIRQLEDEMGTALFRRLSRGVELTESGTLLLERARRILDDVERTKASVQSQARGVTGRIQVGFAGATYFQPLVPAIIGAYRRKYPGVTLSPEQSNTPRLVEGLHNGDIDVAFVRPPVGGAQGLRVEPIIEETMLIVLQTTHPLAFKRSVPLRALADETFILFPRAIGPGLFDAIIAACQRAGFSPKLGQEAPQIPSIVHMVAAGFGVSIVPQSIEQIHADGVVYRRVQGKEPRAPISLAYRRDDNAATVRNFVALVRASSLRPRAPAIPNNSSS